MPKEEGHRPAVEDDAGSGWLTSLSSVDVSREAVVLVALGCSMFVFLATGHYLGFW